MKKLLLLFIIYSNIAFSQDIVKADLSNPKSTLFTHFYFLQKDSYDASKAAITIRGISRKEALDKVVKIKKVLDGKGLKIDWSNVPDNKNYVDTIYSITGGAISEIKHQYIPFPSRMPEIYVEKIGQRWYFSKETIKKIDKIYKEIYPFEFVGLKEKFPLLFEKEINGIYLWKPIGLIILILVCILLYYLLYPVIVFLLKRLQKLIVRDKSYEKSFEILGEIARPLVFIIILEAINKLLPSLQLFRINNFLFLGINIAKTIFWVFVFLKLTKLVLKLYGDLTKSSHTKLDEQLAPILKKIILGIIILIGFLKILTIFGVNPTTVLAGVSIGGIALAFAAQDSVKNLIGTVNIFLDKPFRLGDWVEIGNVVGTVEKVGLRSTRIRAADTSIFQIPNSKVSEADINNKGLRLYRRYQTELGIRYDTPPDLIQAFVNGIREIIVAHPDTRSESYNVEFNAFGDSALIIMVNVFFKKLDWGSEQSSKHRLLMAIVKLAEALGVQFAFPSSTVMIEQIPGKESLAAKYNMNKENIEKEIKKVLEDFNKSSEKEDANRSTIPDTFSDMDAD